MAGPSESDFEDDPEIQKAIALVSQESSQVEKFNDRDKEAKEGEEEKKYD